MKKQQKGQLGMGTQEKTTTKKNVFFSVKIVDK
jgi:hypothetical protein